VRRLYCLFSNRQVILKLERKVSLGLELLLLLDINMLVNFMKEHDHRLLKRAPCFFNLCVPCITEEYKLSIFFHTSKKKKNIFGLRLLIIAEEATSELMDSFEVSFNKMLEQFSAMNSIELFHQLEERMFTIDRK